MSEEIIINAEKFYQRLERLQTDWLSNKNTIWGGSDALLIGMGTASDDVSYNKSSSLNLYLFGYEFPDSIILIIRNNFYFMSSSKKCSYLETFLLNSETSKNINSIINLHIIKKTKDEGQNRENMNVLINAIRKNNGKKVGSLYKNEYNGNFIPSFMDMIDNNQLEKYEISSALGLFLAVKDETELV